MTERWFDGADLDNDALLDAFRRLPDVPMDAAAKHRVQAALPAVASRQRRSRSHPTRRQHFGSAVAALAGMAVVVAAVVGIDHYNSTLNTVGGHQRVSAVSVEFTTYHNQRFGFTVDLPNNWVRQVSGDGGGLTLVHPTGDQAFVNPNSPANGAVLTVRGVPNATMGSGAGQQFAQMLTEVKGIVKGLHSSPGVRLARCGVSNGFVWMITERSVGRDATEYYKAYFNLSTIQAVQLVYPTDEQARYSSVIDRVSTSFVPGQGKG